MKKLLISAIIASVATFGSFADFMFWQVTSPVTTVGGESPLWNCAALWYVPESGNAVALNSKPYNGTGDSTTPYISAASLASIPAYADLKGLSGLSDYAFYIELYVINNDTVSAVAKSQSVSFNEFKDYITTSAEFRSNFSSMNAFGRGEMTWTAVPEPTSGLLLLLGMAGLALRRRKV